MATNDKLAEDKKKLAAEQQARDKQMADKAKHAGTPTPTQEEANLLKLGHAVELAPDGSPPDPNNFNPAAPEQKDMQAAACGGYQTRQAAPAHHRTKE